MIRSILLVVSLSFLASPAFAQSKAEKEYRKSFEKKTCESCFFNPWGKGFAISSAAYWSGFAADLHSTRGLREANPLARNSRGGVSTGKAFAVNAAGYGVTLLFEKKHPKAASIIRFIAAGAHFGAVAHNRRVPR